MNYATIKYCDIANGPGVRTSLFVSGCTHHCPGCFNEVAWPFDYGEPFTEAVEDAIIASVTPFVAGLTLLGGEPMEPENQAGVLHLLRRFRAECPGKTAWCYSGYTFEQLTGQQPARCSTPEAREILSLLDVLVDGRFVQALHDITLRFRGSSNQRLLDLPKTLAAGKPVLWEDEPLFATHGLV